MTEQNNHTSVSKEQEKTKDILSDPKYICNSCTIITDFLRKGCDVVQMPNGDIIIREQKIVTTKYRWDYKKEKIAEMHVDEQDIFDGVIESNSLNIEIGK